jgi:hypothetical protein
VGLQHFFRYEFWQEALVLFSGHLYVVCLLASSFFQRRADLLRCVIVLSTEDMLAERCVLVLDDGLDELACGLSDQ